MPNRAIRQVKRVSLKRKKNGKENLYDHLANAIQNGSVDETTLTLLIDTGSDLRILDDIPDPRRQGSVVYNLKNILIMIICAIVSDGKGSPESIADHIWVRREFYAANGLIPDVDHYPVRTTIEDILKMIKPEILRDCLIKAVYSFSDALSKEVQQQIVDLLIFDGKEICSTGRGKNTKKPGSNVNMVNMYSQYHGVCLESVPADSKGGEIPVVQKLLYNTELKRRFISFDALHTQDVTLDYINSEGGWYVAALKNNQKKTYEAVKELFDNPKNGRFIKQEVREKRTFDFIRLSGKRQLEKFPSAKYAVKMISSVRSSENPTVMYFISNSGNIDKILHVIEVRWDLENGLHKLKDSDLMNEDDIRTRDTTIQQNLVTFNNFIAALVRFIQASHEDMTLARAKKTVRAYPLQCLKYVCGMITDQDFLKLMKIGIKKETMKEIAAGTFDPKILG